MSGLIWIQSVSQLDVIPERDFFEKKVGFEKKTADERKHKKIFKGGF